MFLTIFDKHHEKQRYSIRKYAFGAASVLIGCAYMANAQVAHADQTTAAPVAESTTTSTNVAPTQPATTVDTTTQSQPSTVAQKVQPQHSREHQLCLTV